LTSDRRPSLLTSHARFPQRICRRARGDRVERVGRRGGWHHPVCDRLERSAHARRVPIWRRIPAAAADRIGAADQMAAWPGLARRRRARRHVFCVLHRAVQSGVSLHDRRAGLACTLDFAVDDHARRRRAWRGGARCSQKRRRDHRHGWRCGRTRHRPCARARRGLARRPDHGRGHAGDGALQRVVASVHRSLEPVGVCHRRHGIWLRVPRGRGRLERQLCERCKLSWSAMDGGGLSGRVRRRRRFFPLGVRARAHDADANRHHHDDQSGVRLGRGRAHIGRADRDQPRCRSPRRVRRNLDRHERLGSQEA